MNRLQPTPSTASREPQLRCRERLRSADRHELRDNKEAVSAVRAISTTTSKASSGISAGCNELLAAQDMPIIKKIRCESQKAN